MGWRGHLTRLWAYGSMVLVAGVIVFLFAFVFYEGSSVISWEFLTQAPSGAVLGEEGGIWPAIVGSLCFTATAVVLGGIPAIATALFLVFYCRRRSGLRADPPGGPVHLRHPLHRPGPVRLQLPGPGLAVGTVHPLRRCGPGDQ